MKINIKSWDITLENTEAIVNSSSRALLGWWWVCGSIFKVAWKWLYDECLKLRDTAKYKQWLKEWDAVLTEWYNLNAKYIIHTLWPDIRDYKDDSWRELLSNCYTNSLQIADKNNITSISFPLIWNWAFGLDIKETSIIVLNTIRKYFNDNKSSIKVVNIIIFNNKTALEIYNNTYKNIF